MAAKRGNSNKQSFNRKSTNDLFESDNDSRFKTMYAQAFKDHNAVKNANNNGGGSSSTNMMSPLANKNMQPLTSKITTPVRSSLNTIDNRKPPIGSHASPDPKLRYERRFEYYFDL